MDKEKIIDNLKYQNKKFYGGQSQTLIEAIKLIEQQPSEDCVSRQAVFETIDDCNIDGLKGIFCSYNAGERFKEYIKELPPVTPKGATNRDVITAMFPNLKIANNGLINEWLDEPYKRGNKNG